MLYGDSKSAINRRMFDDPRVTSFWDPKRIAGNWFGQHAVGGLGGGGFTVWDAFYGFRGSARWVSEPTGVVATGSMTLPPNFCGGRAIFAVHATSSTGEQGDGLVEVNCQIHDPGGKTPAGTSEGVKVNARGINFNKHVTGDNLLVML